MVDSPLEGGSILNSNIEFLQISSFLALFLQRSGDLILTHERIKSEEDSDKLYFYFLYSVGSSHSEKKTDGKIVVWHLHQQSTELHEQLHWFEDVFLSASSFPVEQLLCWETSMTISGFQIWVLKCVLCILYSASTIRLFHEISWIHLKKSVVFARFSTRETWACFSRRQKKI